MPPTAKRIHEQTAQTAHEMCKLAELLWLRQNHVWASWEDRSQPFTGWTTRCVDCGENLVVQYLPPRMPMAVGLVINMLPGKCGDRVYVPARDELDLEVWA